MLITASRGMLLHRKAAAEPEGLYREFQELRLAMLSHYEKEWTMEKLCERANMEKASFIPIIKSFSAAHRIMI